MGKVEEAIVYFCERNVTCEEDYLKRYDLLLGNHEELYVAFLVLIFVCLIAFCCTIPVIFFCLVAEDNDNANPCLACCGLCAYPILCITFILFFVFIGLTVSEKNEIDDINTDFIIRLSN